MEWIYAPYWSVSGGIQQMWLKGEKYVLYNNRKLWLNLMCCDILLGKDTRLRGDSDFQC